MATMLSSSEHPNIENGLETFPLVFSFVSLVVSFSFAAWVAWYTVTASSAEKMRFSWQTHQGSTEKKRNLSYDGKSKNVGFTDEESVISNTLSESPSSAAILMSWRNVSCSYPRRNMTSPDATLPTSTMTTVTLNNAHGQVLAGEVTAIMGPSGGGKSTLINVLAGRKAIGDIHGMISILGQGTFQLNSTAGSSGRMRALLERTVAYVPQDESFFPMQTSYEAVEFVARLRHGKHGYQSTEISAILAEVGLGDQALYTRPIGGELAGGLRISGLSGGECKRLALACALILKPKFIMLDEITSGLDSDNALLIMKKIKEVCRQHRVASITIIHQPNGYVFQTFDRLILLSKGQTLFSGHVSTLQEFYENYVKCPMPMSIHELPVDLMEKSGQIVAPVLPSLTTAAAKSSTTEMHSRNVVGKSSLRMKSSLTMGITDSDNEKGTSLQSSDLHNNRDTFKSIRVSSLAKLQAVFLRNLLNHYVRNLPNLVARVVCYAACALLTGALFWGVGSDGQNPSMVGAFTFLLLSCYLLPFATIPFFVHDKKFYVAERSLALYPPWIYCVAQAILELWVLVLVSAIQAIIVVPMLGILNEEANLPTTTFFVIQACLAASSLVGSSFVLFFLVLLPSQDLAFTAASGLVTFFLGISGGFVPYPEIQDFIAWLQWVSPCKYSLQALSSSYFMGDEGEAFLDSMQLNRPATIFWNIGVLLLAYVLLTGATVYVLSQKREIR